MPTEAIKQFWQKTQTDTAIQAKIAALEQKDHQPTLAAVIKLAAESGCVFSAQEYEVAVKEELARQHAAGEISDEQLEAVAGGIRAVGGNAGTAVFLRILTPSTRDWVAGGIAAGTSPVQG